MREPRRLEPIDAKLLEDAHTLMHPTRYRIVKLLAERPMHIDWISRALDMKRGLVAYHLDTLQARGFVKTITDSSYC